MGAGSCVCGAQQLSGLSRLGQNLPGHELGTGPVLVPVRMNREPNRFDLKDVEVKDATEDANVEVEGASEDAGVGVEGANVEVEGVTEGANVEVEGATEGASVGVEEVEGATEGVNVKVEGAGAGVEGVTKGANVEVEGVGVGVEGVPEGAGVGVEGAGEVECDNESENAYFINTGFLSDGEGDEELQAAKGTNKGLHTTLDFMEHNFHYGVSTRQSARTNVGVKRNVNSSSSSVAPKKKRKTISESVREPVGTQESVAPKK
ncbi:hypothetical protein V6N11_072053 [Hibiscus sabdariffa]|uniref:Uncharacterized protein n=1 Tax=Hibiscus sabdariffa TaxID=183260 RepID=A0ABR2U2B1_9ROSI